jgi:anti-anti-sigma factor
MVNPAKVSFSTQGDVTIIHLPAELIDPLDIATARDAWRAHVLAHKPHRIVVNFDVVRSCGSEAVGGLVHLGTTVRNYGGEMKLCSMSERIREIFEICRLVPGVFELYNSAGEAIDSFQN